jgi:hypothetical protein
MRIIDLMTGTVSALALIARAPQDDAGEPLGVIEFEDNLSEVDKPPEIPAGKYNAEVQDIQVQTSQKGNKYYAIKFVIPPDELAADISDNFPDGAVLYWNRQVVPNKGDRRAMFNLRRLMESMGLDTNTTSFDPNEMMGAQATVRVRHRQWEGENRAEISAVEASEQAKPAASRGRQRAEESAEEETPPARQSGGAKKRGQRGRS